MYILYIHIFLLISLNLSFRAASDFVATDPRNPDLFAFLARDGNQPGILGIAWLGSLCSPNKAGRVSITEFFNGDLPTAQVRIL